MEPEVRQKRIDEDVFMEMRKKELALWPTGKEVDLEEAVEYHKKMPDTKNVKKVLEKLKEDGRTRVWPRAGAATLEDEINLVKTLYDAGVRTIPVTTDSYSRNYRFDKIEEALAEQKKTGVQKLNGYPVVNHGVKNTRKVIESVDAAFMPRGHVKLAMEIALASGMTGAGKSCLFEFGSYEKKATLPDCVANTQYTNRLCGYYADHGVIITTDIHGLIPSGTFPLTVNIATIVIDSLIAAEQGVKSIVPQLHCMGNLAQDVATGRLTPRMMREYLDKFGFTDVAVPGTFNNKTPLYPVPMSIGGAFAFMCYSAVEAVLAGTQASYVSTVDEGAGIPTEEAHKISYEAANWMFNVLCTQNIKMEIEGVDIEEQMAEKEVKAIVDRVIEMGNGDVVIGAIKAVEAGVIDSPFSPNIHMKDEVLGTKDARGACRILEFGNLPFSEEIKNFHREKIAERENKEGRKNDYKVVVEDFWAFSKGKIIGNYPAD
jgi:methylaspartate mutase epsilon subunit